MENLFAVWVTPKHQETLDIDLFAAAMEKCKGDDRITFLFEGFDDDPREIYEIPVIRAYAKNLLYEMPEILLYLSRTEPDDMFGILLSCVGDIETVKKGPYRALTKTEYMNHVVNQDLPKVLAFVQLEPNFVSFLKTNIAENGKKRGIRWFRIKETLNQLDGFCKA